ncbi:MAG: ComF family protein [Chitinophagaceae bacterium]
MSANSIVVAGTGRKAENIPAIAGNNIQHKPPFMTWLPDLKEALLHFVFPHTCAGCGTDVLNKEHQLCLSCLSALPETKFCLHQDNPVEKIFWGRIALAHATAQYYYTKESLMQRLMHRFKYRGEEELGTYLGTLMGQSLAATDRFDLVDALIPLPLHPSKERKRGYNQAAILCNGIAAVIEKPVWTKIIHRQQPTETQTKKSRTERWENIKGKFQLLDAAALKGKHVLLVDDVLTTGATLEACTAVLLEAADVQVSIATLCFSSRG